MLDEPRSMILIMQNMSLYNYIKSLSAITYILCKKLYTI